MINILVPVYNEEFLLEKNIERLNEFLSANLKKEYKIIIVDGKSTDKTPQICQKLSKRDNRIGYIKTGVKGKGAQLKKVVPSLKGEYSLFIDADLPIMLNELLEIIKSLLSNEADLVIASRYVKKTRIKRSLIRVVCSKLYSLAIQLWLRVGVKDTIAGCKAWNSKIQRDIWPLIKDDNWFFDTELIYLAYKKGYKIKEVSVSYSDRGDSKFSAFRDGLVIAKNLLILPFKYQNEGKL